MRWCTADQAPHHRSDTFQDERYPASVSEPGQVGYPSHRLFCLLRLLPSGGTFSSSMAELNPATSLAWGDVAVDNHDYPWMVQFHLKRSKYDQFGAGADAVVGVTGSPLCLSQQSSPVYIVARGSLLPALQG